MIDDFGDRNPDISNNVPEEITPENWTKFRSAREVVAIKALERVGAKLETHNLLVLVDLQGMYLELHKWLRKKSFPIKGGLVLSRMAFFQIDDLFQRIKSETLKLYEGKVFDFETLLEQIEQTGPEGPIEVSQNATYVRLVPRYELFYARAPLNMIELQLRRQVRNGSGKAKSQLDQIQKGILSPPNFERDYDAYDDFIAKLKANPEYSKSEEGFFNYYVGPQGLHFIDEKEVDTLIVMRAMDVLNQTEAKTLCIVSSDQDFMPLHKRARELGIQSYQADLAKFEPDSKHGRKLKELGSYFLPGQINAKWPLKIIIEASAMADLRALYTLDEAEFDGLCQLHNEMNDVQVSPHLLSDGHTSIRLFRPAI